jgi:2-dehydro-3-deoxyphosphogluconate aldolase/(4S)-4-hydroxy-2-oxoglutarate aldolase
MKDTSQTQSPEVAAILARAPVIPVLTVEETASAVSLARALVAGGLMVLEVTLRTERALEAARAITAEVEGAVVGIGTVLTPAQMRASATAGVRFAVSPGTSTALLDAAAETRLPYLPGVATASEIMVLLERGYTRLKFFPAENLGGVGTLKALAAPFRQVRFCPTGGIDAAKAKAYLALDCVAAVGGSWVAPADSVAASDWATITRIAREAAALGRKVMTA